MNRPLLSQASRPLTFEIDAVNERGEVVPTAIAGEHPLTLAGWTIKTTFSGNSIFLAL